MTHAATGVKPVRVQLIGKSNGVGLTKDLELLAFALRENGCEVSIKHVGSKESRQRRSYWAKLKKMFSSFRDGSSARAFDINVMLEHVWPMFLNQANQNVVVPNPEFFDDHDVAHLKLVDRVWAKTKATADIFSGLGCQVSKIGFDSEDRAQLTANRRKVFFHLAGSSPFKGTGALVAIWAGHPEWPTLTVVHQPKNSYFNHVKAGNIQYVQAYMSDLELKQIQNESLFHICTSETEGWGHYLVEAMSVGAVVITLDAPPMNELVTIDRGLLLPAYPLCRQKLAQCYRFDESGLVDAVNWVLRASEPDIDVRGAAARQWFLQNKLTFVGRLESALKEIASIESIG